MLKILRPLVTIKSSILRPRDDVIESPHKVLRQLKSPSNTLWGDSITSSRGRRMEDFIVTNSIFNTGSSTHIDAKTHSFSCLDLSLCSPALSVHFRWSVPDDPSSSNHLPILLLPTTNARETGPPRWCFQRADWSTFTSLLTPDVSSTDLLTVEDQLTLFTVTVTVPL